MDINNYPERKKRLYRVSLLAFFVIALFCFFIFENKFLEIENTTKPTKNASVANGTDFFDNLKLEAKSAYVLDIVKNESLLDMNAGTQLPLASLTKVITALTSSELLPDYRSISISPEDIATEGDSGLSSGEEWNFRKLINFALLVSSNDAMSAIASLAGSELQKNQNKSNEELFIDQMNKISKSIGLTQTYFVNESGLDVSHVTAGGYGSARDMAKLFEYILKNNPNLLEATQYSSLSITSNQSTHQAPNTNIIVNEIPNLIASKTGFTPLSGGNLVIAFNAGLMRPIVISVLGSTEYGRFTDMQKLVNASMKYLESQD